MSNREPAEPCEERLKDEPSELHTSAVRSLLAKLGANTAHVDLEILRLMRVVNKLYEHEADDRLRSAQLSTSRLHLLLHLLAAEEYGGNAGTPPTFLSHQQRVSKNTVSALLRGLEEQGLIERKLDPIDKRVFRIRVSAAGKELIATVAPQYISFAGALIARLTHEEQQQLVGLLRKLHVALLESASGPPA